MRYLLPVLAAALVAVLVQAQEVDTVSTSAYDVAPWPLEGFCPSPEYPDLATRASVQGRVDAALHLRADGSVSSWRIVKEDPRQIGFREQVENVLSNWAFSPALKEDRAVESDVTLEFSFLWGGKGRSANQRLAQAKAHNEGRLRDPRVTYQPLPIVYVPPPVIMSR